MKDNSCSDFKSTEAKALKLKCEGKFFIFGVLIGSVLGFLWQSYYDLSYVDHPITLDTLKNDANQRLLDYIEGKWSSSVGDLIINVDVDSKKDFLVVEMSKEKTEQQKKYKIVNITRVNGLLGIVNAEICNLDEPCNQETFIPIQFNKVFGKDKTIAISYDSRLTYCIESDDNCTRAFKRIE